MQKIPTIFKRNPADMSQILTEPHPACDWVFAGEEVATRKYDGSCCMMRAGVLYRRREIKKGKPSPDNFELADFDETTGKTVGWVPVDFDAPEDKYHVAAYRADLPDGTYELLGPNVQGNPENLATHTLLAHADAVVLDAPRTFEGLSSWLDGRDIEGIVWHHPDGRMAKIKLRDFGLRRIKQTS